MASEAMVPDWSSLIVDLINHIADCFLGTNDLDYYVDFHAICHNWHATTPVIGSYAIFLSAKFIVVDAERFPGIEADCIYFQLIQGGVDAFTLVDQDIYKYDLHMKDDEEPELVVSADIDNMRPFTITQLLSSYSLKIPCYGITS
ncbi:hypothetical protein ACP70R_039001 [Stipagrostis hirtigluma subsp. patula]